MRSTFIPLFLAVALAAGGARAADAKLAELDARFRTTVQPFLETYCVTCHGKDKPEAEFDLTAYTSPAAVANDASRLGLMIERLHSEEMPPAKAKKHPAPESRGAVSAWFQALRDYETRRHAGDPGIVLARRLSNAEYDYTIRDLTGVDLKPTREFPQDPTNPAGFDNSGESLAMTPSLLNKYLKAAREVASHLYLKRQSFGFAPHPMIVETDRDKFVVHRIIDFYRQQNIDLADYFQAAWAFKHRAALGQPRATLAEIATARKVSTKYLATVWETLEGAKAEIGPLAKLQTLWRSLPVANRAPTAADATRKGSEEMRAYVVKVRAKVEPRFLNLAAGRVNGGAQSMMIWKNVQYATHRMTFDPLQLQVEGEPMAPPLDVTNESGAASEFGPGRTVPVVNQPGDPDLAVPAGERARYEAAWGKFCRVFPDKFIMEERGRNYFNTRIDRGRYLSAGFHSDMGYFRDDQPLYELILDEKQRKELDEMWFEMDLIASTTARMYIQSNPGRRRIRGLTEAEAAAALTEPVNTDITSEAAIKGHLASFMQQAASGDERGRQAGRDYFTWINATIRTTEQARIDAEPSHLDELMKFAARAYRRPLTAADKAELVAFYREAREKDRMDHETAMRECLVLVLMAPDVCYRIDLAGAGEKASPLSDSDLASRLSYFLWSSLPDEELLAQAAAGKLRDPKVIAAQARRMLQDPRARALAVEFGGNWLDFRRFEGLGTVDVARFPAFTNELRQAMFEEPVRFMLDIFQSDRPVLDFLYANHTFVNPVLAKHYGMPATSGKADAWVRIDEAHRYGRGGLLPMAAFMTKNAPGLRTSPVKRGYWVVKHVLGEHIPAPPPNVPELPADEAKLDLPLRDMLARHRQDPNCAACHARFDSYGLVFEGFDPVGDRRDKDLAGRPVNASAAFPGGERTGLDGLRQHIRERRQDDFVENLCRKVLVYSLGRSPILPDDLLVQEMKRKLAADGYRFASLIESIVTSPQFLNKRGRDDLAGK